MAVVRGVTLIVSNFEVTVEKLVYGGDGLARLDGRVVFAPFVLPGGRIRARVEQEKPAGRAATISSRFSKCCGAAGTRAGYRSKPSISRRAPNAWPTKACGISRTRLGNYPHEPLRCYRRGGLHRLRHCTQTAGGRRASRAGDR